MDSLLSLSQKTSHWHLLHRIPFYDLIVRDNSVSEVVWFLDAFVNLYLRANSFQHGQSHRFLDKVVNSVSCCFVPKLVG